MRVLLVHGLGRTPLSLAPLSRTLRRAGHEPISFGYAAFAQPYDRIRARLVDRLRELADGDPVGLIGHSLGGLLLRHALADVADLKVHHLVMLGTPNHSPRRARLAMQWLPWRLFARSCGRVLATPDAFQHIPAPRVPYTVIAGTGGPRVLARPFGSEPHDGFVAVNETRISENDDLRLLPVGHTFMMNDRRLHEMVVEILKTTCVRTSSGIHRDGDRATVRVHDRTDDPHSRPPA